MRSSSAPAPALSSLAQAPASSSSAPTSGVPLHFIKEEQYYLIYQHEQFKSEYIGLPLTYSPEGRPCTLINNNHYLITFNLGFALDLISGTPFQQVLFYDSVNNFDCSEVSLAPPHKLTMNKGKYYIPWSRLVWVREGIMCPLTVTLLLGQRRPAVERMVTARWMYDQHVTEEILRDYFDRSGFSLQEVEILEPGLGYLLFENNYAVHNLMYGQEEAEYYVGDSNSTILFSQRVSGDC